MWIFIALLGGLVKLVSAQETSTVATIAAYKPCGASKHCVPYEQCNEGLIVDHIFYPDRSRTILDEQSCHYMEKCCNVDETLSPAKPLPYNASTDDLTCGCRSDQWYYLRPLGYKQQEAKFGEFPWLVAIYGERGYLCSGALIMPLAVLTAAHCVEGESAATLRLVAGEWDAAVQLEPLPEQTRRVSELLLPPSYAQSPSSNNVALLMVEDGGFKLAPHVQNICLPPLRMIYNYSQCYVAGWQRAHFGAAATLPKRWPLYVLPPDQCASKLRLAVFGRRYVLNETLLCTGGDKGDFVCSDMGAVPLMCPLPDCHDRYVLAGLLARAVRCDGPQLLGIYTDVNYFLVWIDLMLQERDQDIWSYML